MKWHDCKVCLSCPIFCSYNLFASISTVYWSPKTVLTWNWWSFAGVAMQSPVYFLAFSSFSNALGQRSSNYFWHTVLLMFNLFISKSMISSSILRIGFSLALLIMLLKLSHRLFVKALHLEYVLKCDLDHWWAGNLVTNSQPQDSFSLVLPCYP